MLSILLPSCSSTNQAYLRTLKLAWADAEDIMLENEEIAKSPADLIYVKKGQMSNIVLALAYIEQGQYKWISADNAVLVEHKGRIIKTSSLGDDLAFVFSTTNDPLNLPMSINSATEWERKIDLDSRYFGLTLHSDFKVEKDIYLKIQDKSYETILIEEKVNVIKNKSHQFDDDTWINQFWYDKNSGDMLRSKQKLFPGGDFFNLTYVSRAIRL